MELSQNDFSGWHTGLQQAKDMIESKRLAYMESKVPKAVILEDEVAETEYS